MSMMESMESFECTIFDTIFDNSTSKKISFQKWSAMESFFYKLSNVKKSGKEESNAISPAIYKEGSTRANKNVLYWGKWFAIDVDTHSFESSSIEQQIIDQYQQYQFICHSTASSTIEHPKFRLLFPLNTHVKQSDIKGFWYAINKELGSLADPQTKDLSRLFYLPAKYDRSFNFFFIHSGSYIDPALVMTKYPYVKSGKLLDHLPEEYRKEMLVYKQGKIRSNFMNNNSNVNATVSWSGYRDCPFVNKRMIDDYKSIANFDGTGRYSKLFSVMVSISTLALKQGYPISEYELESLVRDLDRNTTRRYEKRRLDIEAQRAIQFAYSQI
jgi:hypothetical protein